MWRSRGAAKPSIDFKKLSEWPRLELKVEAEGAYHTMQDRPETTLRMLSWNVWFDDLWAHQRQRAVLKELLRAAPDVACLQEVLPGFAAAVRECGELLSLYDVSPQDVRPYGVLLLVRRELGAVFPDKWLPSHMARRLVSAELRGRWPGMFITSVHLESLNHRNVRKQQLSEAAEWMRGRSHSILCGDFNFDDTKTWGDWKQQEPAHPPQELENHVLLEELPGHLDCWREVNPQEPGYTFDGKANPINCHDPEECMRYDRVMANVAGFMPKAATLLGTDALEEAQDWGLRPSDHFGLLVDLEVLQ